MTEDPCDDLSIHLDSGEVIFVQAFLCKSMEESVIESIQVFSCFKTPYRIMSVKGRWRHVNKERWYLLLVAYKDKDWKDDD